jgi:hypothetical protein
VSFFNTCWHQELTPEDDEGRAVCVACGEVVTTRLTEADFFAGMRAAFRYGYGEHHHAQDCMNTSEGWCCAPGCTVHRAQHPSA